MEEIKTGVFKVDNNIPIYIIGDILSKNKYKNSDI